MIFTGLTPLNIIQQFITFMILDRISLIINILIRRQQAGFGTNQSCAGQIFIGIELKLRRLIVTVRKVGLKITIRKPQCVSTEGLHSKNITVKSGRHSEYVDQFW